MECVSSASSLSLAKLFVSKNALLMGYVSAPAWMSFARRLVSVRGGVGVFEAAGVGRDGKIECVRQRLCERYAEKLQEL